MVFNGSNIGENIDVSANGGRVRFFRNIARHRRWTSTTSRSIDVNALGGADNVVVNDLTGTDVTSVDSRPGRPRAAATTRSPTTSIVNGTNGDDVVTVAGAGGQRAGHRARRRGHACPARSPAATG